MGAADARSVPGRASGRRPTGLYAKPELDWSMSSGIEPGAALRDLEARILAQDPSIGAPRTELFTVASQTGGNLRERPNRFVGRDSELQHLQASRGILPAGHRDRTWRSRQDPPGRRDGGVAAEPASRRGLDGGAGRCGGRRWCRVRGRQRASSGRGARGRRRRGRFNRGPDHPASGRPITDSRSGQLRTCDRRGRGARPANWSALLPNCV